MRSCSLLSTSVDLLTILREYAAGLNIADRTIIAESGLPIASLRRRDARIPMHTFQAIWMAVLKCSGDPDFGLHFGEASHSLLRRHLLYAMMMNCANVGQAIRKNFQYHALVMDIIRPVLKVHDTWAQMTWEMGHPGLAPERHLSESVLALFVAMLRYLTEDQCRLTEVRFSHPCPKNTAEHERIFQAPLAFGRQANAIVMPRSVLDQSVLLANPTIMDGLEKLVQKTLRRDGTLNTWTGKTAQMIFNAIRREEGTTIDDIAARLALGTRSLQMKLKAEGTSFRNIHADVRKEIAVGYLADDEASICEIALLLGFADQSAFQNAFKRWTGQTPGEFRRHPPDSTDRA
jgi:AraC-like DNA-binding protein